jgi:FAD synthase
MQPTEILVDSLWSDRSVAKRLSLFLDQFEMNTSTATFPADIEPIDSTSIAAKIRAGDVAGANVLIGRPFELAVRSAQGAHRGVHAPRSMRVYPDTRIVVPRHGLYDARTRVAGQVVNVVLEVPRRVPDANPDKRSLIVHIDEPVEGVEDELVLAVVSQITKGEASFEA